MVTSTNSSNRLLIALLGVITHIAPEILLCSAFTTSVTSPGYSVLRIPCEPQTRLSSTTTSPIETTATDVPINSITTVRDSVISTARSIASDSPTGAFLLSSNSDSDRLNRIVTELEALSSSASPPSERERVLAIGDWELICTSTTYPSTGGRKVRQQLKLPSLLPKLPTVQDAIRKSLTISQRIRSIVGDDENNNEGNVVNRVDNVVEFTPPTSLQDLLPDVPVDLKLNPLEVSRNKVALVHAAEVESLTPVFRTRIKLQSVVVNVAGTSQFLEPDGADIFGINIPSITNDFSNSGTFDTTYVDEKIRISRGKAIPGSGGNDLGFGGDTLRVFVRKEGTLPLMKDDDIEEDDDTENDNDVDGNIEVDDDTEVDGDIEMVDDVEGDDINDETSIEE